MRREPVFLLSRGTATPCRLEQASRGVCDALRIPGYAAIMMGTPYPIQFIDHGASIQLLGLSNNAEIHRTIHLRTAHAEQAPDRMGQSVGRWEGNTLVVTTTRIDWPYFLGGVLHNEQMQTVERFDIER